METLSDEERYPTYVPPQEEKQVVSQLNEPYYAGLESVKISKIRGAKFWLRLVLIVVVVAGVVGGAVGGSLKANKQYNVGNGDNDGSTGAVTDGASSTISNGAAPSSYASSQSVTRSSLSNSTTTPISTAAITTNSPTIGRMIQGIAAAQFLDTEGGPNIEIYYQEESSNYISYSFYKAWAAGFGPPQTLQLLIQPKQGTPLTATAYIDSLGIAHLNLFYLDSGNNIIDVAMVCTLGYPICSTATQNMIYANKGAGVSSSSGLCALYLRNSMSWRIFYHDSNNAVSQLVSLGGWHPEGSLSSKAREGSSIACSLTRQINANVFYVDASSSSLYIASSLAGGNWAPPILLNSTFPDWNPSASLTATAQDNVWTPKGYFIGESKTVYEITNGTGAWVQWHSPIWSAADSVGGPIAAVGWSDQIRFYYASGGRVAQGILQEGNWTENFVV